MDEQHIRKIIRRLQESIPATVTVEAAAKTRSAEEVRAAIDAGISVLGYNYVQEAETMRAQIQANVTWHLIGHLQKNKVKKAVPLFDMIETIDSVALAEAVQKECEKIGKTMRVLIEINSGEEAQKAGVAPDAAEGLIQEIRHLPNLRIGGLMTMGPWVDDPEELRPYFRRTREIFDHLAALNMPGVEMTFLSMGMSDSYRVAIEEGATLVRLGTILFGPRKTKK